MSKVVLLKFGEGDCNVGFHVNLRIRETGKSEIEADGRLSPAPELPHLYQDWRMVYGDRQIGFRKIPLAEGQQNYRKLKKTAERITNISVHNSAKALECCLNDWLSGENEGFRPIRERLLHHLNATDEIRFVISARSPLLWQLPWHLCDLFTSYPHADVTLGSLEHPLESLVITPKDRIKILVVLGGAKDINVEADLHLLRDRLPEKAELLEPLVATDFKTLTEALWQNEIDILFFAGHSTSQGQKGRFFLNETDSVEIQELKYALQKAIARGLKLAMFNSCDGVQLARDLADVQMPAVIVMREPIPDEAAQAFLSHFLEAFAEKKMPLYRAVRESRERLQGLEKQYPYLTWLPVLYQHPEAKDLRWDGMLQLTKAIEPPATFKIPRLPYFKIAVIINFIVVGGLIGSNQISQYLTNKGMECFDNHEYECAARNIDLALRFNPNNVRAFNEFQSDQFFQSLIEIGSQCFDNNNIECASRNFDLALKLNPDNARALNEKGLIFESLQEYDKARFHFQRANLKGDPAACNNEARLDIIQGDYQRSENLLSFCLPQVETSVGRYSMLKNLGWALVEQKEYYAAAEKLQQAISITGMREEGPANCLLAITLENLGNNRDSSNEWQYCLNAKDNINEERDWKKLARKRLQQLQEKKS